MTHRLIGLGSRILGTAAAAAVLLSAVVSLSGPAGASTAAPHKLRTVQCRARALTFNVYYGTRSEKCFQGPGQGFVLIPGVSRINTGANSGYFELVFRPGQRDRVPFHPREPFPYPRQRPELLFLHIN